MAQPPKPGTLPWRALPAAGIALCVALIGALLVGCSSGEEAAPRPTTGVHERPIRPPEPLPDTRGVALAPVAGTGPVFPVSVHGGELVMGGSVVGPGGPVAGATVRLERFVGERSGTLDVRTNARGRWVAIDVHGGRYRFRAWHTPDLAMAASDVRFIAADAEVDLTLAVDRFGGADVTGDVDDVDPEVGATASVTALATRQQVDGDGIITTVPASGRDATVAAIGPWDLQDPATAVIDASGRVAWRFTCRAAGSVSARIEALGTETTVSATCVEPVTVPPPVVPPDPVFAVGASFTPPFAGPLPAGTYEVTDHPGTCGLTYQAWAGDQWDPARRTATGTGPVTLTTPARDLRPLGDSPACTYERTA